MASKLAKYRSMRDFSQTAEPSGDAPTATTGHSFVIQKHAARRLHYDFRLELDGVLLSWSVPKGPSLSPSQRRLAVRTEDHPLGYASFEGIIPAGQYGGGTVAVWDRGSWQPEGDPHDGMKKGRLTFTLDGEKLHGRWHLVKTKPQGKQEAWLLFKGRDDAANDKLDITVDQPASVITGRTIEEIADAKDRVWQSNRAQNANVNALLAQLPLGFTLTSLDKVLYPEQGITKGDLIAYLAVASEWMLPHIAKRPLTLVRCPEGMTGKPCFFQKTRLPGSPAAVHPIAIREEDGETVNYMQIVDMPGLVALAQLGTLEIHTWGCHTDKLERPDLMVLDLDPDPALAWDRVALAAFDVRKRLNELGLTSWVKTTGGKGLHVVVPIKRTLDWDPFKAWTKQFVEQMAHDEPELYTANMSKTARKGKIFVDYLRNGRNATAIAPYSPRARAGAPVAVPITWEELAHGVDPAAWTTKTVPKRLATLKHDPWHDLLETHQVLPKL
ncbi:MAG: non-homologous end-joining DNA ligase [Kofleriaceae bacterium]